MGVTIKSNVFAGLFAKVPKEFHSGLQKLDSDLKFVQGRRMEAKFTDNQNAFFLEIQRLVNEGHPVVMTTRKTVGKTNAFAPGGEEMYKGILGGHCYGVERTRVDFRTDMKFIDITNPWGKYVRGYDPGTNEPVPVVDNLRLKGAGQFTITLHELFKKFEYYSWSPKKLRL